MTRWRSTIPAFVRNGATTGLDIMMTLADPNEQPSLRFDTDYLDAFSISDIRPIPVEVVARGDQIEFVFAAPETPEVEIAFDLSAGEFGRTAGTIATDQASVRLSQLVYP